MSIGRVYLRLHSIDHVGGASGSFHPDEKEVQVLARSEKECEYRGRGRSRLSVLDRQNYC